MDKFLPECSIQHLSGFSTRLMQSFICFVKAPFSIIKAWCSKLNLAFSFFIHSAAWHVRQRHSDVAFSRFWGQAKFKNQLSENSPASNRQSVGLTCDVHQQSWHHQTSLDQSPLPHLRGASQQLRGQTTKQNIN